MRSVENLQARWWAWKAGRALARARQRGDVWEVRVLRATHLAAQAIVRRDYEAAEILMDIALAVRRQRVEAQAMASEGRQS